MATPPGPPFRGIDWDDELEQRPAARRALARGALRAERFLRLRAGARIIDLAMIEWLHRMLFIEVWPDFAGVLRGPGPPYLHRNVTYGRRRGEDADRVPEACRDLCDRLAGFVHTLDRLWAEAPREGVSDDVLKVASYAHCELIRIHPFENGNGRLARTVLNYFAARYGFLPLSSERPKGEYTRAISAWFDERDISGFMDFLRPSWKSMNRPP